MRRTPSQAVFLLLAAGVAVLPPPPASAYVNAGFRSRKEYERYLKERGITDPGSGATTIGGWSAPGRTPHDKASAHIANGEWRKAVKCYDEAISAALADPVNGPDLLRHVYCERGDALWILKEHTRALADYRMAVKQVDLLAKKRGSHNPYFGRKAYLRLAVALAASPDPALRDRAKIVALAEAAVAMEVDRSAECEAILAGLHAVLGDFPAAVRVQRRLVKRLDHSPLRETMNNYLERYRDRKRVWAFDRSLTGPADPRQRKTTE